MRSTFATIALAMAALTATARTETVKSPNGHIVVTVKDDGGTPTYSVTLGGVQFLAPSPLGVVMNLNSATLLQI